MHGQDFDKFACATLILHNTQFNASLLHVNTLVLPKKTDVTACWSATVQVGNLYKKERLYNQTLTKFISIINPLNPESDQHLISPYNITTESYIKVMRIKEMIISDRSFWLVNKFSLSVS